MLKTDEHSHVSTHICTHTHTHHSYTEVIEGLTPEITRGTHLPYSPLTPRGKPWALSVGCKGLWLQAQVSWKISTKERVPQGRDYYQLVKDSSFPIPSATQQCLLLDCLETGKK